MHRSAFTAILNAKSVQEINEQLQTLKQQPQTTENSRFTDILHLVARTKGHTDDTLLGDAYSFAIQRCSAIQAFDEGFRMFNEAKQSLAVCPRQIFADAMRLTMQQDFSANGLAKCFDIFIEMKTQHRQNPDVTVYKELIKNATALKQFDKAEELVQQILQDAEHRERYLQCHPLRSVIVNYYAKARQIKRGLDFMHTLMQIDGNNAVTDSMYSSLLSGIAALIKDGHTEMTAAANSLFKQTFNNLARPPNCSVFNSFLTCYANVPEVEVCMKFLRRMISKQEWPNPDGVTFAVCLNSLVYHRKSAEAMDCEQVWKYVDDILALRQDVEMNNEVYIYGPLFNICSGFVCNDMEKLYKFYDEMERKKIKLTPKAAHSLIEAGIDHYQAAIAKAPADGGELKQDMQTFVDWAEQQFKKYDLPFDHDAVAKKMNSISSRRSLLRNHAGA